MRLERLGQQVRGYTFARDVVERLSRLRVRRARTVRPLRHAKERALGSVGFCCLVDLKDARYLSHKEARSSHNSLN